MDHNRILPFTKFVPTSIQPPLSTTRLRPSSLYAFIITSNGREATLKLLQYTVRLYLTLRTTTRSKTPYRRHLTHRLLAIVSFLSALRRLLSFSETISALIRRTLFPSALVKDVNIDEAEVEAEAARKSLETLGDSLDTFSVVADFILLLSRLVVLPSSTALPNRARLSIEAMNRLDRLSSLATMGATGIGLYSIRSEENQIWRQGRSIRKGMVEVESRLEEANEFWESDLSPEGSEEQEMKLRLRAERRKLRRLRKELNQFWYQKIRLCAEGIFALVDLVELQKGSQVIRSWSGITSSAILMFQTWSDRPR